MTTIEIAKIQADGSYIYVDCPLTDDAIHQVSLMSDDSVTLSWLSESKVVIPAMSHIVHGGKKYYLLDDYESKYENGLYKCTPAFVGAEYTLANPVFCRHITIEEESWIEAKFDVYANLDMIAKLIVDAISNENIYGEVSLPDGHDYSNTEYKSFSFDGVSILDAINTVAQAYEVEWWVERSLSWFVLHFDKCEATTTQGVTTTHNLSLTDLSSMEVKGEKTTPAKRLFVYGSERNLIAKEATINNMAVSYDKNLKLDPDMTLPDSVASLVNLLPNSILEVKGVSNNRSEIKIFDDIYPRYIGAVDNVRTTAGKEGVKYYHIRDLGIDFNIDKEDGVSADGDTIMLQFTSGSLNGQHFEANYSAKTKEFEIIRKEVSGVYLPNDSLFPQDKDSYVPYNFLMPDELVVDAQERLLLAAAQYIAEKIDYTPAIECVSDAYKFEAFNRLIRLGHEVVLDNVSYRVVSCSYNLTTPYEQIFELSTELSSGIINKLKKEIEEQKEAAKPLTVRLKEYASDGILSPAEKSTINVEWLRIKKEYTATLSDAERMKLGTVSIAQYKTAYSALSAYALTILDDLTVSSQINRATFESKFDTYYDSYLKLITSKSDKLIEADKKAFAALPENQFNSKLLEDENFTTVSDTANSAIIKAQTDSINLFAHVETEIGGIGTTGSEYATTTRIRTKYANRITIAGGDKITLKRHSSLQQDCSVAFYNSSNQRLDSNMWFADEVNTFTAPANSSYCRLIFRNRDDSNVDISDFKYKAEAGDKATTYTPAPADTAAEMAAIDTKATLAQSTANTAQSTADTAKSTANTAKSTANTAASNLATFTGGKSSFSAALDANDDFKIALTGDFFVIDNNNVSPYLASGKILIERCPAHIYVEEGRTINLYAIDSTKEIRVSETTLAEGNFTTEDAPTTSTQIDNDLYLQVGYTYLFEVRNFTTGSGSMGQCNLATKYSRKKTNCIN